MVLRDVQLQMISIQGDLSWTTWTRLTRVPHYTVANPQRTGERMMVKTKKKWCVSENKKPSRSPLLSAFNTNLQKAPSPPIKASSSYAHIAHITFQNDSESDTDWYRQRTTVETSSVIKMIMKDNEKYMHHRILPPPFLFCHLFNKSQALPCPLLYLHACTALLWHWRDTESMSNWILVLFKQQKTNVFKEASATFSERSCAPPIESHKSKVSINIYTWLMKRN